MREKIEHIKQTVTSWPEMTANPHRFGGLEFNLASVEIGHIHLNGMVDIPFNSKIRNQLLAEARRAASHPAGNGLDHLLYPISGGCGHSDLVVPAVVSVLCHTRQPEGRLKRHCECAC